MHSFTLDLDKLLNNLSQRFSVQVDSNFLHLEVNHGFPSHRLAVGARRTDNGASTLRTSQIYQIGVKMVNFLFSIAHFASSGCSRRGWRNFRRAPVGCQQGMAMGEHGIVRLEHHRMCECS